MLTIYDYNKMAARPAARPPPMARARSRPPGCLILLGVDPPPAPFCAAHGPGAQHDLERRSVASQRVSDGSRAELTRA